MTHPDEQVLLLYAYGETAEGETHDLEEHLSSCAGCRGQLLEIERGRLVADLAQPRRLSGRRLVRMAAILAAAATVARIAVLRPRESTSSRPRSGQWLVTGGYVAGGPSLIALDSTLTRLEQELRHEKR
jgi:hypothetical protein